MHKFVSFKAIFDVIQFMYIMVIESSISATVLTFSVNS